MWAAAATAPAGEAPTLSTETPTPRSAHSASARASWAPSPSASRYTAIEPTPSSRASCAIQAAGSSTAEFPHEITVCSRSPRRVARVFTATLPLCDTSATRPASSGRRASPQSATRSWRATIPFPFGPQRGRSWRRAASARSRSIAVPCAISPKPAPYTTAPPQPIAPASSTTAATPAAGMATTTASGGSGRSESVGKHGTPCASSRPGFTPQTVPG